MILRINPEIEQAVLTVTIEEATWGCKKVATELGRRGIRVSPTCVRSIWRRHDHRRLPGAAWEWTKRRIAPEIEQTVLSITIEQPTWGERRVATELRRRGISVSPSSVRSIWLRHGQRRPQGRRIAPEIEQAVLSIAAEQPAWGLKRVAKELRQRGISVSPFCVRSIRLRHPGPDVR